MSIATHCTRLFRRVVEPDAGTMPPELARSVERLDLPSEDPVRYEAISAKALARSMSARARLAVGPGADQGATAARRIGCSRAGSASLADRGRDRV